MAGEDGVDFKISTDCGVDIWILVQIIYGKKGRFCQGMIHRQNCHHGIVDQFYSFDFFLWRHDDETTVDVAVINHLFQKVSVVTALDFDVDSRVECRIHFDHARQPVDMDAGRRPDGEAAGVQVFQFVDLVVQPIFHVADAFDKRKQFLAFCGEDGTAIISDEELDVQFFL